MPTKDEVKMIPVLILSPHQGVIIFQLEAISALVDRHHMGRTSHGALWVFIAIALHTEVLSS